MIYSIHIRESAEGCLIEKVVHCKQTSDTLLASEQTLFGFSAADKFSVQVGVSVASQMGIA